VERAGSCLTSYEKDINTTIRFLNGMDAAEVGLLLAIAADARNSTSRLSEVLLDLHAMAGPDAGWLPHQLNQKIKDCQHQRLFTAWMIWLHTARAAQEPQLRYLAKEMWRELERGFPYLDEVARELLNIHHRSLVITRGAEFPEGLDPHARY
jgi:hypothetical protein